MRAKFNCQSVKNTASGTKKFQEVNLSAVYGGDKNSEDNQFSESTPSGTLTMMISNENAIDYFVPGKSYYIDFSEAKN